MATDVGETVTVNGELSAAEFWRFNVWIAWRRNRLFFVAIIVGGTLMPALALAGMLGRSGRDLDQRIWGVFVLPLIGVVVLVMIAIGAKRRFAADKLLSEPGQFTFSAEGIESHGSLASGKCSWAAICRAEESKTLFLLWVSAGRGFVVPKRHFTGPSQMQQFRAIVSRQLGERATLRDGA